LITVTAGDGGTVSLSEIEFSGASSDATNILRKEVSFATNSYTPTAVGVRSDSTLVTSGSGSQLVSKVIFLVACRNFVVATTNDYNQVVQYLLNNTNANGQFVVTATARVVRGGVTVASGTDQTVFTVGPRIHEKVVGDFQLLTALSGAGRLYGVESTTEFVGDGPGTVWTNTGLTVGSRESISLPTDIEHKFYRLVTLP
jgi:hypothetical protein